MPVSGVVMRGKGYYKNYKTTKKSAHGMLGMETMLLSMMLEAFTRTRRLEAIHLPVSLPNTMLSFFC